MSFAEFVGNRAVIDALTACCRGGRLSHAVLLTGESGTGKSTLAALLAQALVCRGQDRPCGRCGQCAKAAAGIHPDISVLRGEGDSGSFKIDAVRAVTQQLHVLPGEAGCRVYILDGAQDLTDEAVNALLKAFEEPPEHVYFILTCVNRSRLLPTLRSRAAVYNLIAPGAAEAAQYLRGKALCDAPTAEKLAADFGGNIGDCVKYLADAQFRADCELAADFFKAAAAGDAYGLQKLALRPAAQKRRKAADFTDMLYARAVGLLNRGEDAGLGPGIGPETAERLSTDKISNICAALERAKTLLGSNCQLGAVFALTASAMR